MSAKKPLDHDSSLKRDFLIVNERGLHARPAAKFVKIANRFACEVFVEKDGEKVNGKSIMGLLMLAAGPGSTVTVHAQGRDASLALEELETLFHKGFEDP